MQKGQCKLCKKTSELLKQSHILPNFLYKPVRGDDGEFYSLKSFKNKTSTKKIYTGYFERNILCQKCDNNIIGSYESYFASILDSLREKRLLGVEKVNSNGVKYVELAPVDYLNTKLFFLSVLWRASISHLDEFSRLRLDQEQDEELRSMVFTRNPGPEGYYPIFPMMMPPNPLIITKTFAELELEGHNCFSLVVNGSPTIFCIQSNFPKWVLGYGPKSNNTFLMTLLNEDQGKTLQNAWIEETVEFLKKHQKE